MEIYLRGTRMFMIMEVNAKFSLEAKARADQQNTKVLEWEHLMCNFQQAMPDGSARRKVAAHGTRLPTERMIAVHL
jgi:L-rhamnose mutarotase